ncbi:MAG: 50S ribosomal protein L21 [Rhodomicrobium sp.]
MYAVIRTGGKQYKVAPQDVLQIEKIEGAAGEAVQFPNVLMVAGDGEPSVGAPLVSGAVVAAEVVEQGRGPKIIIFKKRRRQNYRRKRGHRQDLTTVRILEIFTDGRAPVVAKREAPVTEEAVPVAPLKVHAENAGAEAAVEAAAPEAQSADSAETKPATEKKPRAKKAE